MAISSFREFLSQLPRVKPYSATWRVNDDDSLTLVELKDLSPARPKECPDASVLREKNVLRTRAAACYLGLSPWKVRELVRDGRLPVLSGKYWRFRLEDLDEFLKGGLL